jgi:hypothetical protein
MARLNKIGKTHTSTFEDKDEGGCYKAVRYHHTMVVKVYNTRIILDTGGWKTITTKARMNQASCEWRLGYQVFQKDFSWFVKWRGNILSFETDIVELRG